MNRYVIVAMVAHINAEGISNRMTPFSLKHLPHAAQVAAILTASEPAIRSAVGSLNAARRVNPGRSGGRPRSNAPRCDCGAMTANLAGIRRHVCTARRVDNLMAMKMSEWPDGLFEFVREGTQRLGLCGDVVHGLVEEWVRANP